MFSTGQMVFALLFFIAFVAVLVVMYRRDRQWQRKQYKGTFTVLLLFAGFIILLLLLKYFLKN
ncbi:hypothetical protein [Robiginitalea sp. SC105]|uniref:hypothetical protein n=1 Tax=Robiginitalea sp. SC105 TaxID=2762332 RepID=UPI00163A57E9|nr:hypothetical protein [Robiginitalea sp. SC105]MBC2839894.1 hypothetical protein [Robiginitalea sp. SC105]